MRRMGNKYIIEKDDKGSIWNIYADKDGVTTIEGVCLTPYTEPDLEQVRKDAYDKGFNDGRTLNTGKYEKGLIDAWECAKKIQDTGGNLNWWIHNTSASEAIEKIRQYEREQEEIKVGDEVIATSGKAVIVSINDDKDKARYIYHDSTLGFDKVCNLSKTGRHFPEIAAVLKKMRGEQE